MAEPSSHRKTMGSCIGLFLILVMFFSFGCAGVKKTTAEAVQVTDQYAEKADYLYALAVFYLNQGKIDGAGRLPKDCKPRIPRCLRVSKFWMSSTERSENDGATIKTV